MALIPAPKRETSTTRPGEPIANWCRLSKGDTVDIFGTHGALASGQIDMLSCDGSMLWIIEDEGRGRTLFLYDDGVRVRRRLRA